MLIIGCDYHPGFQQIAFVDTETGELEERRLAHRERAEQFYQELKQRNVAVPRNLSVFAVYVYGEGLCCVACAASP